jgi:hypothetical protein
VVEISDERLPGENATDNQGDGIWCYLKTGYCSGELQHCVDGGCVHVVHAWSWSNCERELRRVRRCMCADCVKGRQL